MLANTDYFRTRLRSELATRCQKNPRYSLRAFARALSLSDGALSEILSGKRTPALRTAERIIGALALAPEDRQQFLSSLADKQRSRGLKRLNPAFRTMQVATKPDELALDLFRVMSEWYHIAILELTFVPDFDPSPEWLAKNLEISAIEAKLALDRLISLGLLEERDGRIVKTNKTVTTADKHVTTPALRNLQKQLLEKSMQSLENDPIETRNHSAMTMAIDPSLVPVAKQMIETFTQTLRIFLESGQQEQVYNLGIGLYPVQKKEARK
jgi:uncharacterized protein (TIGR02147 family)